MRSGFILPGGSAREQLELAILAERCGWDGVFVWEAAYGVDAWSLLAAMAASTTRVSLGTLLTPLPWRRPWKVASQVATVDQLSRGRVILTVGLGAVTTDLPRTGETEELRERAELLDEGIELIRTLWQGGSRYQGRHYSYQEGEVQGHDLSQMAQPVQARIPIWVVGVWPRPKSMRRVLACQGIVPQYDLGGREPAPEDARRLREWLSANGAPDIDVIAEGNTPADDPVAATGAVRPWESAGCSWWLESRWELPHHSRERLDEVRQRLLAGPPAAAA